MPEAGWNIPVPKDPPLLQSMVKLSKIMSRCVHSVYSPRHNSALSIWNAASDVRQDLHLFGEQQIEEMDFGLVGDPMMGEKGVCQAMVSTSE